MTGGMCWFSAMLISLALSLLLLAELGGKRIFDVSLVPAGGAALSSLANALEDGLRMEWAFYAFVLGSGITPPRAADAHRRHRVRRSRQAATSRCRPSRDFGRDCRLRGGRGPLMLATWVPAALLTVVISNRRPAVSIVSVR